MREICDVRPRPFSGTRPMGRARPGRCCQVRRHVQKFRREPRGILGRTRQAHRLDKTLYPGEGRILRAGRRAYPLVSRRHPERVGQLPRPASRHPRRPDGDRLGRRRPGRFEEHHLSRTLRRSLQILERAEGQWCEKRRPDHDLSADDPGNCRRRSGLCAYRGGAFGHFRRFFA